MPTPARTTLDEIVRTGRSIMEKDGLDGLTMAAVASAVGVRPPSLYKHVPGRSELIRLIAESLLEELTAKLSTAAVSEDPGQALRALAMALRDHALSNPEAYRLLFAPLPDEAVPDLTSFAAAAGPVLRAVEALGGPEDALEGARLVTAWAHGFLSMELSGSFHLEGDLDRAYEFGIDKLVFALQSR